tara:strand:- start:1451 stop:3694 length:2244 start_codon:yes stop_codon:yes gene_type:complete
MFLFRLIVVTTIFFQLNLNNSFADLVKKIEIYGNERISKETVQMFSNISINEDIDEIKLNNSLKNLFNSNFFSDVSISLNNNILTINVVENPIIQEVKYNGIKAQKIRNKVLKNLNLKSRSSYNEILLKEDKDKIKSSLKDLGYYFSNIDIVIESLNDNKVNVTYQIDLGDKSKIKKISFIGNKIFKDRVLKSLIVSSEYKFWKIITGKKYLNENIIQLDNRLLKNFYLNKGYYNVEINSSFAKSVGENEFELIFNINANEKFYFNNLELVLPTDFETNNYDSINNFFEDVKGRPYSINQVEEILEKIEFITLNDQFLSINSSVEEKIIDNLINLKFLIEETDRVFVEKINIFGNNITRENVIRNQLIIDEGDPYNKILANKSLNNLQSLNFFRNVKSEIVDGKDQNSKIINITVEEKATGQISAGAGLGTSGSSLSFGVKENNYLGKGINVNSNLTISDETVKGLFSIRNRNYNNTDKSVYSSIEALETDRLTNFGYKTNRVGFSLGTDFEYFEDFYFGIGASSYFEDIETNKTASDRQKAQTGNYWDTFLKLDFNYDKRNQKFQTTDGFKSTYFVDVPILSETNTLTNTYNYDYYTELYENNVSSFTFFLKTASSLSNDEIKLSERIYLPSSKLRGFERGKVGPKDGDSFIGGNYAAAINLKSTIPKILENSENIDFLIFADAANVWGVDYFAGNDEGSHIRSSVGIGIDWLTPIGPLSFTLAEALSKSDDDITESFSFNIGTTF